jgi:hypothetical protein
MLEMSLMLIALKSPTRQSIHFSILQMSRECLKALSGFSPPKHLKLSSKMVIVEQHPNIQKWTNVFHAGKLVYQLSCRAKALRLARRLADEKKSRVYDIDQNELIK